MGTPTLRSALNSDKPTSTGLTISCKTNSTTKYILSTWDITAHGGCLTAQTGRRAQQTKSRRPKPIQAILPWCHDTRKSLKKGSTVVYSRYHVWDQGVEFISESLSHIHNRAALSSRMPTLPSRFTTINSPTNTDWHFSSLRHYTDSMLFSSLRSDAISASIIARIRSESLRVTRSSFGALTRPTAVWVLNVSASALFLDLCVVLGPLRCSWTNPSPRP